MRAFEVTGICLALAGLLVFSKAESPLTEENICSFHQEAICDDRADCTIDEFKNVNCVCREGNGDGTKLGSGCGKPKCRDDDDCHPHAYCDPELEVPVCNCKTGYFGDGKDKCEDINECAEDRCSRHAHCNNTEGSFRCTCTQHYQGNGFQCQRYCATEDDCSPQQLCQPKNLTCICKYGYNDEGDDTCINKDECELGTHDCHINATCNDTEGSFTCTCKNGYEGDGKQCKVLPKNCAEVRQMTPTPDHITDVYKIDPDGTGPLEAVWVKCELRPNLGITYMYPVKTNWFSFSRKRTTYNITYEQSIDHIKAVIGASGYCYQTMKFYCQRGEVLMDGHSHWVDGKNNKQHNWGGATQNGKCACGQLNACKETGADCNCNGQWRSRTDEGKIIDKDLLPILSVYSKKQGVGYAKVVAVACAPTPFDIPLSCHDAKINPYYRYRKNGVQIIDVDGPDGVMEPFLAYCDMESFSHAGVAVVPHGSPDWTDPIGPSVPNFFNYSIATSDLKNLINKSHFCMQEAWYECTNSRLLNNGDLKGYFTSFDRNAKAYWPGGMGVNNSCACAITRTCESDDFGCNCDIMDGKTRTDFGILTDRWELPIWSMVFDDIGGSSSGRYRVGPLMCSDIEFGIPTNCQKYLEQGRTENHTHMIDPDGSHDPAKPSKVNHDPFPAYCVFNLYPPYAETILNTNMEETEENITTNMSLTYTYLRVSLEQISMLTYRSAYCTQNIYFTCINAPIFSADGALVTWTTAVGRKVSYFAGDGGENVCGCGLDGDCSDVNKSCNCDIDDFIKRFDIGTLTSKEDLPVVSIEFLNIKDGLSEMTIKLGPLVCTDLFPTCSDLKSFNKARRVTGEPSMKNGIYAIDIDGPLGLSPFAVVCSGYATQIPNYRDPPDDTESDPSSPVTTCFDVKYSVNKMPISPQQVQKVVQKSRFCAQKLAVDCVNAQVTDRVHYRTCNDNGTNQTDICWAMQGQLELPRQILWNSVESDLGCTSRIYFDNVTLTLHKVTLTSQKLCQPNNKCDCNKTDGWAGSKGEDKCACGVTGTCDGGKDEKCSCDLIDGKQHNDGSWMFNKTRIPVCGGCITLDPAESLTTNPKYRKMSVHVSDLYCSKYKTGGGSKNCQDSRDQGMTESTTIMVDPDHYGYGKPFPLFCRLDEFPPIGVAIIFPKEPVIIVDPNGIDHTIEYYIYSMKDIERLIIRSVYCTQEIILECIDAGLDINATSGYGWYSRDGVYQTYWPGNTEGNTGCKGGVCNCNLDGYRVDGGNITNKYVLPASRIILGQSNHQGNRTLRVGPVICKNVYSDCNAIKVAKAAKNPLGNHHYGIDPDGPDPIEAFVAECDFKSDRSMGITKIKTNKAMVEFWGHENPGEWVHPVYYQYATYEQVYSLTTISNFCHMGMRYDCRKSPIINFNDPAYTFYSTYTEENSTSYGTAHYQDIIGCACSATGSCEPGYSCHCDVQGERTWDYGYETEHLPITEYYIGGQNETDSISYLQLTDLTCAPKPHGLPEDCDEAAKQGYETGEVLILPDPNLDPLLVFCKINKHTETGVTIIYPKLESNTQVWFDEHIIVEYYAALYEQIIAVIKASAFCYQPIKYDCFKTRLFTQEGEGKGYFYWLGGQTDEELKFIGNGRNGHNECNCGVDGLCGGSENKTTLINMDRLCNCESGDSMWRADAGVISDMGVLPIRLLNFTDPGNEGASGFLTVGPISCSEHELDIDECKLGFHDCHEKAVCTNTFESYKCRCKKGWRGYGRLEVWANGRNCTDDDECAINKCPASSLCTNTIGSYFCTCKNGYTQTGPRSCKDIDECTVDFGQPKCDPNARCINLAGSYDCRCNRGYKGNGFNCYPVAQCSCFGDPHCLSFDDSRLDFQGDCQYVLSTNKCNDTAVGPPFEVLAVFSDRGVPTSAPATWVEEVTVNVYDYSIRLMQGKKVRVNRENKHLPFLRLPELEIVLFGDYVEVITDIGIQVNWNGRNKVTVFARGSWEGQLCGLCGDYNGNLEDDWVAGPACPDDKGQVVDNSFVFGMSWTVPSYAELNPVCTINCTAQNDTLDCPEEKMEIAELGCGEIYHKAHGPFQECLNSMSDEIFKIFYESCIYDICRLPEDSPDGLCESAEKLAEECKSSYGIDDINFRSTDFCAMHCEENMEYLPVGPANQKTCMDILNNTISDNRTDESAEGCFCKAGFVLDEDRCILEDACGCLFEGEYFPIGDIKTLPDCRQHGECKTDHQMHFTNITCVENATCILLEGEVDCHCKPGLYGDGTKLCIPDPCSSNPCNVSQTCSPDPGTDRGYICKCPPGYAGDCDECEDINECLTETHGCPARSSCINTPGSYSCVCEEGFMTFGDRCKDKDECKPTPKGKPKCDDNSRCVNKMGGFECVCCAGFKKGDNGSCVVSTSGNTGHQPRCCTCIMEICKRPGKVCGTDGVTYNNMKHMILSHCEKGVKPKHWTDVEYYSKCQDTCTPNPCPAYQTCDKSSGKPKCICECSEEERMSIVPVCTSQNLIFTNNCSFRMSQCRQDAEIKLEPSLLPCEKGKGNSPVGPWSKPGPCSVTCGKGTQVRTRQIYKALTPEEKLKFPSEDISDCYKPPCPDGVCFNSTCDSTKVCVVNEQGDPQCECPTLDENDEEEVCGMAVYGVSVTRKTWENERFLRRHACVTDADDYVVSHKGPCGDQPAHCTKMPKEDYIYGIPRENCTSLHRVVQFECDGPCGRVKELCCHPVEHEVKSVRIRCDDQPTVTLTRDITIIKKCECIDVEIAHAEMANEENLP